MVGIQEGLSGLVSLLPLVGLVDLLGGEELDQILGDMLVVGEADLLVEKVALKDGVGTGVEDLDED